MKLRYNAPATLSFTLLAAIVLSLGMTVLPGINQSWFSTPAPFHANAVSDYVKLFSHILGHANVEHFISNFTFILLLGPILELTYGSWTLVIMMLVTALVTGLINVLVFPSTILMGASGIVFMMILLASFTNFQKGEVPITFILVMVLFLGREVWNAIAQKDNISQFAHILGGLTGSFFGFLRPNPQAGQTHSRG
jgi:membrane associated rhomboid family serine protease